MAAAASFWQRIGQLSVSVRVSHGQCQRQVVLFLHSMWIDWFSGDVHILLSCIAVFGIQGQQARASFRGAGLGGAVSILSVEFHWSNLSIRCRVSCEHSMALMQHSFSSSTISSHLSVSASGFKEHLQSLQHMSVSSPPIMATAMQRNAHTFCYSSHVKFTCAIAYRELCCSVCASWELQLDCCHSGPPGSAGIVLGVLHQWVSCKGLGGTSVAWTWMF